MWAFYGLNYATMHFSYTNNYGTFHCWNNQYIYICHEKLKFLYYLLVKVAELLNSYSFLSVIYLVHSCVIVKRMKSNVFQHEYQCMETKIIIIFVSFVEFHCEVQYNKKVGNKISYLFSRYHYIFTYAWKLDLETVVQWQGLDVIFPCFRVSVKGQDFGYCSK